MAETPSILGMDRSIITKSGGSSSERVVSMAENPSTAWATTSRVLSELIIIHNPSRNKVLSSATIIFFIFEFLNDSEFYKSWYSLEIRTQLVANIPPSFEYTK